MHRTGVEGAGRRGLGFGPLRREIFLRLGDEFRAAAATAEIIRVPRVRVAMRCFVRIDAHATHRIAHASLRCRRGGMISLRVRGHGTIPGIVSYTPWGY